MSEMLAEVLQTVWVWAGYAFVILLCLAGVGLSAVSISGTWLVTLGALVAALLPGATYPGVWTIVVFTALSAAVEAGEALAGSIGVSRRGGSKLAGVVAMVGGLAGLAVGSLIPVPVVGSLLGMVAVSFGLVYLVEQRRLRKAAPAIHIAWGTVAARVVVILMKVVVTLGMVAALGAGIILSRW